MLGVHGNVRVRERERERERERGDFFKKIFLRICNKKNLGQRQIEVYLHCSGRYKPFNITNCSFTPVFDSSEDDAFF